MLSHKGATALNSESLEQKQWWGFAPSCSSHVRWGERGAPRVTRGLFTLLSHRFSEAAGTFYSGDRWSRAPLFVYPVHVTEFNGGRRQSPIVTNQDEQELRGPRVQPRKSSLSGASRLESFADIPSWSCSAAFLVWRNRRMCPAGKTSNLWAASAARSSIRMETPFSPPR